MTRINVDQYWLTCRTGDPFADTGGKVIEIMLQQHPDIYKLIEFATKWYVNNWGGKLQPFFLNSTITSASYKPDAKINKTIEYFSSLIEDTAEGKDGVCQITGRKTRVYLAGRNNHILSGSFKYVNFNLGFQPGVYLSKEMLIRMFFVPLGVIRLANKLCIIISNNDRTTEWFVKQNCEANSKAMLEGTSTGTLKSIFNNPANALFGFVDDLMNNLPDVHETDNLLQLIHFSNYGPDPDIVLPAMRSKVFAFYSWCNKSEYKEAWQLFIKKHYRIEKGVVFNEELKMYFDKEGNEITYEVYAGWRNGILNSLLYNKNINKFFVSYCETTPFPFELICRYQTHIRDMRAQSIEKIQLLISHVMHGDEDSIKKNLMDLNKASSRRDLRQFMVKLFRDATERSSDVPLPTVSDINKYLLPENGYGGQWKDVRDMIVMGIYQKQHEAINSNQTN